MAVCEVSLGKHQGVAVHSVWFNTASCNKQREIGKLSSNEKALRKRRVQKVTCNRHRDKASSSAARVGTWRNNHWQHSVSKEQPQPHHRHTVKTEGNPFPWALPWHQGNLQMLWESGNFCGLYLTLHLPLANSMCMDCGFPLKLQQFVSDPLSAWKGGCWRWCQ